MIAKVSGSILTLTLVYALLKTPCTWYGLELDKIWHVSLPTGYVPGVTALATESCIRSVSIHASASARLRSLDSESRILNRLWMPIRPPETVTSKSIAAMIMAETRAMNPRGFLDIICVDI